MGLTNSPNQATILRLEQRKSYALKVQFSDGLGQKTDLTNCKVYFDFQKTPPRGTPPVQADIIRVTGEVDTPASGQVRFEIGRAHV